MLAGLAGSNELENAELAGLVEVCEDLWTRIHSIYWLKDETAKEEAKKVLKESYLPLTLMKLEQKMKDNTCGSGWIYGSKVWIGCHSLGTRKRERKGEGGKKGGREGGREEGGREVGGREGGRGEGGR